MEAVLSADTPVLLRHKQRAQEIFHEIQAERGRVDAARPVSPIHPLHHGAGVVAAVVEGLGVGGGFPWEEDRGLVPTEEGGSVGGVGGYVRVCVRLIEGSLY